MPGERKLSYAKSFSEQLTLRGIIIGSLGSIVLTMSSMYVALKLGALPWPIIFVALLSMFCLKLLGKTNLNEINVTHTIMSAGAMTAGGMAFTLPGIYILNPQATVNFTQLLVVVLGGVLLGLIFTALIRNYFVVSKALPYPIGVAAADTVMAGDEGGKKSLLLFSSLGAAGLFTVFRDALKIIPATFFNAKMMSYGSFGGIWLSPMLIGVGYIIGPLYIGVWFLGALIGDFGVLIGGVNAGFWDGALAANIKSSLGIGLMVGSGGGIIIKGILPKAKEIFGPMFKRKGGGIINLRWAPLAMLVLAFIFTTVCQMGLLASFVTIIGVWLATSMSAQVVGQAGINPMEVFGIIVLLAVKALSPGLSQISIFFAAAIVAVACGLAGDVMNDFKSGHILKSDPKAQWLGACIGGLVGAFVAVGVFYVIVKAYGPSAFGDPKQFIAPQAGMVAAMVGGIPHLNSFIIGLVIGIVLYCFNVPVMTLGLGVYLPFYLSATAFVGGALRVISSKRDISGSGQIIAAGLLGGEAVIGVIIAMVQAFQGLAGM